MIQVTLTFNTIAEAVAALGSLPQADAAMSTVKPAKTRAEPKVSVTAEEKGAVLGNAQAGSENPPAPAPSAPAAPAEPAATTAPTVKYDDLKAAVFKLAGKSRDAAVAINKQFGVSTMKELAADRWAEALAAVNAKLAELEG